MRSFLAILVCITMLTSCNTDNKQTASNLDTALAPPVKVELKEKNGKFQLYIDKEPFYIKGAGLEFGNIAALANHKGNSFRTWRTNNGQRSGKEVLDEAYEHGVYVTMGIEVARERHGFDYDDEEAVKEQQERIRQEVMELKDHPALIIWGIGNELNLRYTNPKVWDAVNDISKMIHEIDPNHLTTTSLAGISKNEVDLIKERCPDIDILSIQMYGDLPNLPNLVREHGWTGAYMVSEWGATGHWEVPTTEWGAPIEENSTVKAANYLKRYRGGIEADSMQCIGSYVFLWGQKQERTPTWYGVFLEDGKETESIDVMHHIWNGEFPENRCPQIVSYTIEGKQALDNITLNSNEEYIANVEIYDVEDDTINYRWEILPESTDLQVGGDLESRPKTMEDCIVKDEGNKVTFKIEKSGVYRLFVYADDGNDQAATANIPFKVN